MKINASSAEKLLELIRRSPGNAGGGKAPPPQPVVKSGGWRQVVSSLAKVKGPGISAVSLGVEVGERQIRLVKLTRDHGRPRSLELKTVPVPAPGPDAPELFHALRLAIKDFLGKAEAEIWAMLPARSVDLHFLQVPKVGKKLLSNAIFWSAKKEIRFDENEVVFDYEVQGEVIEKGSAKLSVMAYTAARSEFENLRNLFVAAGYPLTGLTLPSAACRNLFSQGWLEQGPGASACLHMAEDDSRLEIFSGGELKFLRVLPGGLTAMVKALVEASKDLAASGRPLPGDEGQGEDLADVPAGPFFGSDIPVVVESMSGSQASSPRGQGFSEAQARAMLKSLALGSGSLDQDHPGRNLSGPDVLELIKPAWERLVRQVDMTLKHFSITLGNEQVGRLYLAGLWGADSALRDFLGGQLGLSCLALDPWSPDNLLRLGIMARSLGQAERLGLALTLGLTESRRGACDLLHTYRQKEEDARVAALNRLVMGCFFGVAALFLGVYVWQMALTSSRGAELAGLRARIGAFHPKVDMQLLRTAQAAARNRVDNLRNFANRNISQAVLHDATELTPENIRVFNMLLTLGTPDEQPVAAKDGATAAPARTDVSFLTIDGYVKGDAQLLEAILSAYMVRLRSSPLFADPFVSKRSLEVASDGQDMLRFTLVCAVRRDK